MSEIEQLRAELARLQGRLDELEQVRADQPVPRRHMLRALGGVAAGAAVGGLAFARPAAATDGDNVIVGDKLAAESPTSLYANATLYSNTDGVTGILGAADNGLGDWTFFPDGTYGTGFSNGLRDAIRASAVTGTAQDDKVVTGVLGSGVTGVRAYGTNFGLYAFGGNTGISATGANAGIAAESEDGYGLYASSTNGLGAKLQGDTPLKLVDTGDAPTGSAGAGHFRFNDGTLYFGVALAEGGWRRLASTDSAGVFVPVTPFRVFDSRKSGSPLTSGSDVTIDCSDARDADTGAITVTDALPAGANAIAFNITVVETSSRGFLSVNPGGTASASASTINWGADNDAAIANGSIVKVDANRQIKIFCGGPAGNSTQYIVDVVGYYH